jgi:hypothetical protein
MPVPAQLLAFRAVAGVGRKANRLLVILLSLTVPRSVLVVPFLFRLAVLGAPWRGGEDARIIGVCGSSRRGP